MERKHKVFDLLYLAVFTAIFLLSANMFFDVVPLPDYLLPLMLVTGSFLFVIQALIQKEKREITTSKPTRPRHEI